MENKDNYSPKEVVRIADAIRMYRGYRSSALTKDEGNSRGLDSSLALKALKLVPQNVRDLFVVPSDLEWLTKQPKKYHSS